MKANRIGHSTSAGQALAMIGCGCFIYNEMQYTHGYWLTETQTKTPQMMSSV